MRRELFHQRQIVLSVDGVVRCVDSLSQKDALEQQVSGYGRGESTADCRDHDGEIQGQNAQMHMITVESRARHEK